MLKFIENIGDRVIRVILESYDFIFFLFYCLGQFFLIGNYDKKAKDFLLEQIYLSCIKYFVSFIMFALIFGSVIIMVSLSLTLNFNLFDQFGNLLVFFMLNEFTPFFTTLFFVFTYSLATKERIDSIKDQRDNIVAQIYLPKLFNSIFIFPLMSLLFVTMMLFSGYLFASLYMNLDFVTYNHLIINSIEVKNILILFTKSSLFGFVSVLIPLYLSKKNKKLTQEITKSFIKTLVMILMAIIIIELLFIGIFY